MRLMLGAKSTPSLLVDVEQEHSPNHFEFWVINGAWKGTFTDGNVTVWHPYNPWSELEKTEILCDDPERLRGDYQKVFDNFHDVNYVAPKPKVIELPSCWDDDIPF